MVDDETKRKLEDHAWISLTNDKGKIEGLENLPLTNLDLVIKIV